MILLDVSPKRICGFNCFDNNIVMGVSNYLGRECLLSFLGEFDFTYTPLNEVNDLLDYNGLFTGEILHVPYMLSKLVGISLSCIEVNEKYRHSLLINKILFCINNKLPVGIGMDAYYLPWNPQRGILHRMHYFLIVGVDYCNDIFYCMDSYLSNEVIKVPISIVIEKCTKLYVVNDVYKERKCDFNAVIEEISLCLSNSGKASSCDKIRMFSHDILDKKFPTDNKKKVTDIGKSNFLFRLTDVANSRYAFLNGLHFLQEKISNIDLSTELEIALGLYKNWEKTKNIIIKGYLSGKIIPSLESAAALINKIASEEELVFNRLIDKKRLKDFEYD